LKEDGVQKTGFRENCPDGIFFKPKIPIWVNFGMPYNKKYLYILCPFGIYYGHLVYFMVSW
jgi:hypothetical protein